LESKWRIKTLSFDYSAIRYLENKAVRDCRRLESEWTFGLRFEYAVFRLEYQLYKVEPSLLKKWCLISIWGSTKIFRIWQVNQSGDWRCFESRGFPNREWVSITQLAVIFNPN
jgi:hypothetical protein